MSISINWWVMTHVESSWLYPLPPPGASNNSLPQSISCAHEIHGSTMWMVAWLSQYNLTRDSKVKPNSDKRSFTQTNSHVKSAIAWYSDSALDRDITLFLTLLRRKILPNKYTIVYGQSPFNRWACPVCIWKTSHSSMTTIWIQQLFP